MMHKLIGFLLLLASTLTPTLSVAGEYCISGIAPELLANARAVIRHDHLKWEVLASTRSRFTRQYVITIIDPGALHLADISVNYNRSGRLRNIKGTIYDATGNPIRKLGRNDFAQRHIQGEYALYTDIKETYTDLYVNQFPFTVRFEYTIDMSHVHLNGTWMPLPATGISLEEAKIQIVMPGNMSFRYHASHPELETPRIDPMPRNHKTYTWQINQLPSVKSEPLAPPTYILLPYVRLASNRFHYDGVEGSMETWQELGHWINKINEGKQRLPRPLIAHMERLTEGLRDTVEIVNAVYRYVQTHTRYVSILLGQGGYRPQDAGQVHSNGYGDCKDLSNFTVAILQALGIRSHYAVIHSDINPDWVQKEFPANNFNHAIVCVPLQHDTLWLETTSKYFPAGFIGSFNMDRYVLLATPQGGVLTRTPSSDQQKNRITRHIVASARNMNETEVTFQRTYSGNTFEQMAGINDLGSARQMQYFRENLTLERARVTALSYEINHVPQPLIKEVSQLTVQQHFRRAGNRLIFQPIVLIENVVVPAETAHRVNPFHLRAHSVYHDNIEWVLPTGYQLQHIPDDVEWDTPWGFYSLKVNYNPSQNILMLERTWFSHGGVFPPEDYQEFARFRRNIQNHDNMQLLLIPH